MGKNGDSRIVAELEDVSRVYQMGDTRVEALADFSF